MTVAWEEIEADERYRSAPPEKQQSIRSQWEQDNSLSTPPESSFPAWEEIEADERYKASPPEKQQAIRSRWEADTGYQPKERGLLGDIGSHIYRGALDVAEHTGRAMQMADMKPEETPEEEGKMDRYGRKLTEWAEHKLATAPRAQPDRSEAAGDESWFKQKAMEGVRSTVLSMAPIATAGAGFIAGGAMTGGSPVGAGAGAIAGGAAGVASLFGLATYHKQREELNNTDLPDEEKHAAARDYALIEAGGEAVADLVDWMMLKTGKVIGASQGAKNITKATIRSLLKTPPKEIAKRGAQVYATEWGTETVQGKLQSDIDARTGLGEQMGYIEAAIETAIPVAVMTLTFGAFSGGLTANERRKVKKDLNSDKVEDRIRGANRILSEIDDPEIARSWKEMSIDTIRSGGTFDFDENIVEYVRQAQEAPKPAGPVSRAAEISRPTGAAEREQAGEKLDAQRMEILSRARNKKAAGIKLTAQEQAALEAEAWDKTAPPAKEMPRGAIPPGTTPSGTLSRIVAEARYKRYQPEVPGGLIDAESIRGDEGQIQGPWIERPGGEAEGGQDFQLQQEAGAETGIEGGQDVRTERESGPGIERDEREGGREGQETGEETTGGVRRPPGVDREETGRDAEKIRRAAGLEEPLSTETVERPDSIAVGQDVNVTPTEPMKEAENYKKAHVKLDGFDISVENPVGSVRSGKDKTGKEWSQEVKADYGYFKGSVGFDKDHVDTFIKPGYKGGAQTAYIINQVNPDGSFDEHKVVLGAESEQEAMEIYNSNYEEGWTGGKNVVAMPMERFKEWVKSEEPKKGEVSAPEATAKAEAAEKERTEPHLGPDELINGISREVAGDMLASGDEDVLEHIREGVKKHGPELMQHAIRNQALLELAEVPKERRQEVRDRIARLQPQIDAILKGEETPPAVSTAGAGQQETVAPATNRTGRIVDINPFNTQDGPPSVTYVVPADKSNNGENTEYLFLYGSRGWGIRRKQNKTVPGKEAGYYYGVDGLTKTDRENAIDALGSEIVAEFELLGSAKNADERESIGHEIARKRNPELSALRKKQKELSDKERSGEITIDEWKRQSDALNAEYEKVKKKQPEIEAELAPMSDADIDDLVGVERGEKPSEKKRPFTPKDGWRDNLIKAREYAKHLGVGQDVWADKDKLVAAIDEALEKRRAPAREKTSGQIVKEAGVSTVKGVKDAIDGLATLFGDPATLRSGPAFDEETYAKAKPYFISAWNHAKDAGHSLKELVQHILDQFGDVIKPYLARFLKDVRDGNLEVEEAKPAEEEAAPEEEKTVTTKRLIPNEDLNDTQLIQRIKAQYPGEDAQSLYGRFVAARDLKPGIDMKDFRIIFDSVSPNMWVEEKEATFTPTHIGPDGRKVQVEEVEPGGPYNLLFEDGGTGSHPKDEFTEEGYKFADQYTEIGKEPAEPEEVVETPEETEEPAEEEAEPEEPAEEETAEEEPKKKRKKKLEDYYENRRDEIVEEIKDGYTGNNVKLAKKLLVKTAKASLMPIAIPENATPGTRRYLEYIRRKYISGFIEYFGAKQGGGRKSWQKSFKDAILDYADTVDDIDTMTNEAAAYIEFMERIEAAINTAGTVQQARDALAYLFWNREYVDEQIYGVEMPEDAQRGSYANTTETGKLLEKYTLGWHLPNIIGDADAFIKDQQEESTSEKNKQIRRKGTPLMEIKESSNDHRKGKDIDSETLAKTFGFSAIGFGDWAEGPHRQYSVNLAFSAFKDLAATLGAPDTGMSIPSKAARRLQLFFGKYGNKISWASAHFEPGTHLINLTKTRGDGSLAHEWGHALDFSNQFNLDNNQDAEYRGVNPLDDLKEALTRRYDVDAAIKHVEDILARKDWTAKYRKAGLDLETARKFLQTGWKQGKHGIITKTEFFKASLKLDNGKDGKYWSRREELFARAFEVYIADKLQGDNMYLVDESFIEPGTISEETGYKGSPYPEAQEREFFNDILQRFFDAVQWSKEGIPSLKEDYVPVSVQIEREVQARFDELEAKLEKLYQELNEGEPSADGLYWYRYNQTARGAMMQPRGYTAYDDDYKGDDQDGQGAVAYEEPLRVDDVHGFQLEAITHEDSDTTIRFGQEDFTESYGPGTTGVESDEGVEGRPPEDGQGTEEEGETEGGTGAGGTTGGGTSTISPIEGGGHHPGEGGGGGGMVTPPAGEGSTETEPGQDAVPLAGNYRITDADVEAITESNLGQKFAQNIAAIRVLKLLENEARSATEEEQSILARYVGWGGLADVFEPYGNMKERHLMLKELLTDEEFEAARSTVVDSFYTPIHVIKQIYSALERFGFKGGKILEPAIGVGHFFGAMPAEIMGNSSLMGGEIDSITARMAQKLYPDAAIFHTAFEKARLPANHFDLVVSNAPFSSSIRPADPKYNKARHLLHDFFFNKSLEMVRPGGIVAMITSTGTMDKKNARARRDMARKADLIGAIRLPSRTFQKNANTMVATDVLFFRKKEEGAEQLPEHDFVETQDQALHLVGAETHSFTQDKSINKYFVDHPEMVLGEMFIQRYQNALEVRLDEEDLPGRLEEATQRLPKDIYRHDTTEAANIDPADAIPDPGTIQDGSIGEIDGVLYHNIGGNLVELPDKTPFQKKVIEVFRKAIPIRDAYWKLIKAMLSGESVKEARKELNRTYNAFVKAFGALNAKNNIRILSKDANPAIWASLEKYDYENDKLISKADIFTKDTVSVKKTAEKYEDIREAFAASLSLLGRVDLAHISSLTDKPVNTVLDELGQEIFDDPEKGYVIRSDYLSGDVRDKLEIARQAAKSNRKYEVNVAALENVIPEDIPPSEIRVNLGTGWIPASDIRDFARETINAYGSEKYAQVEYEPFTNRWRVFFASEYTYRGAKAEATRGAQEAKGCLDATRRWGTERQNFYALLEKILNKTEINVFERIHGRSVLNVKETEAARDKAEEIKARFEDWLWQDDARATRLLEKYNRTFNSNVIASFDGSHLTLPGKVHDAIIELRKHQKDAIWRSIVSGNTYLGHEVGTGKTYTMIGSIMEHKRLGLAKKPLMVVKKSTLQDIESDFLKLYPGANVLVANIPGVRAERKKVLAQIASNNWDAVIITHEMLEKIPLSAERQASFIQQEVDALEAAITAAEANGLNRRQRKALEDKKRALEAKIDGLLARERDDLLTFEELGLDMLVVDEAHAYKNLMFATSRQRVKGLGDSSGSDRALDMFTKTSYLNQINPGRNIIMASGTPVSNSVSELFSIQRYLQPQVLRDAGIYNFDSWLDAFARIEGDMEYLPQGGGYQVVQKVTGFVNLPELVRMAYQVLDPIDAEKIGIVRPKIHGGEPVGIMVPQSPALQEYQEEIRRRAELIKNAPGGMVEIGENPDGSKRYDIVLRLVNDGRNAAIDVRLQVPEAADHEDSKVNHAIPKLMEHYNQTKADKGVQLVFLDRGVPSKSRDFDVYNDIKAKLIKAGVKEKEIAFIGDYKQSQYKSLFSRVRNGDVRFLLGSTEKMGTGVNVQDRVIAMHHLDVDWNYANYEQRNGRGWRYGNIYSNKKTNKAGLDSIYVYNYVTEATIDAFMWGKVADKAKFVGQFMAGDLTMRSLDVVSEETMTASQMLSIAANDPLIEEKFTLEKDLRKLRRLATKHADDQRKIRAEYNQEIPSRLKTAQKNIDQLKLNQEMFEPINGVVIDNEVYSFEKDGKAIAEAIKKQLKIERVAKEIERLNEHIFGGLGVVTEKVIEIEPTAEEQKEIDKAIKEGKEPPKPRTEKIKEIQTVPGIRISVWKNLFTEGKLAFRIVGAHGHDRQASVDGGLSRAVTGFKTQVASEIKELDEKIVKYNQRLDDLRPLLDQPFEKAQEQREKTLRLEQVNRELTDEHRVRGGAAGQAADDIEIYYTRTEAGQEAVEAKMTFTLNFDGKQFVLMIHERAGGHTVTEVSTGMRLYNIDSWEFDEHMDVDEVKSRIVNDLTSLGASGTMLQEAIDGVIREQGILNSNVRLSTAPATFTPANIKEELGDVSGIRIVTPKEAQLILKKPVVLPDGRTINGFVRNGRVYLIQGHVTSGRAKNEAMHEISVHLRKLGMKSKTFQGLLDELYSHRGEDSDLGRAVDRAIRMIPKGTQEAHYKEEVMAYLVGNGRTDISLVRRFIARVKRWLAENMKLPARFFSQDDIQALAVMALRQGGIKPERTGARGLQPVLASMSKQYGISIEEAKRQYEAVEKQYRGTAEWMKAPNGKPTKLNERQWVQVRTPAFLEWFGDWQNDPENASQVVDENGEPMVVYHGTDSIFDTFTKSGDIGYHFGTELAARDRAAKVGGAGVLVEPITVDQREKDSLDALEGKIGGTPADDLYALLLRKLDSPRVDLRKQVEDMDAAEIEAVKDEYLEMPDSPRFIDRIERARKGEGFKVEANGIEASFHKTAREANAVAAKLRRRSAKPMALFLRIKNPIRMADLGVWPAQEIAGVAGFSKSEMNQVANADNVSAQYEEVRRILGRKGFDGIVYRNEVENTGEDSYIAFSPNQIKSATGNTGQFSPYDDRISYSQSEIMKHAKAFYSKLQQVASDKFQGMKARSVLPFLQKQGVKKEELEATGVKEWLAAKKPTDKVTQQELSDFVRANMVEIEDVVLGEGLEPLNKNEERIYRQLEAMRRANAFTMPGQEEQLQELAARRSAYKDVVHFPQYQEPGAEEGSYREMFVTAPQVFVPRSEQINLTDNISFEWFGVPLSKLTAEQKERIQRESKEWEDGHSQYSDIKNPIVRIRFNTRTDSQGRRILFVEEMQGPSKDNQAKMPAYLRDNLYNLGVKRILAYAKENGFDGVSWTTGEMQGDRYSLSKQVDTVHWEPGFYTDGGRLTATKDGKEVISEGTQEEKLADFIGKDAAQKLLSSEPEQTRMGEVYTLSGQDLDVGNRGLRQLYNTTLPKMFEAYAKGKVGEAKIQTTEAGENEGYKVILPEGTLNFSTREEAERIAAQEGGEVRPIWERRAVPFIPLTNAPESFPIFSQGKPIQRVTKAMLETTAFKEWFGKSVVRTTSGEPVPVWHGTNDKGFLQGGEWAFDRKKGKGKHHSPLAGLGNFFALNRTEAVGYTKGKGVVRPFYVSLQNPLIIESWKLNHLNTRAEAEAFAKRMSLRGHDGIIFPDQDHVVVFQPGNIKSAEYQTGEWDRIFDDTRFSVGPAVTEAFDVPEQHSLSTTLRNSLKPGTMTREDVSGYMDAARTKLIDRLHPIKTLGPTAYKLHSLLHNAHAVFATFLHHGKLQWLDQALAITEKDKGFLPWFHSLGKDERNFFYWLATKRAEVLEGEERENWLTEDRREAIRDEIFSGLTREQRAAEEKKFEQLNNEFQKFNANVLDIAIEAGLITEEQRNSWTRDFYLPFYRIMEDQATREEMLQGPRKYKKHVSAQIRRLKGGEEKLGDPLENVLRNWFHLIQESQRNVARAEAATVAVDQGLAEEISKKELLKIVGSKTIKRWGIRKKGNERVTRYFDSREAAEANLPEDYEIVEKRDTQVIFGRKEDFAIMSYQRDGQTVYLRVNDPALYDALTEVNAKAFESKTLKLMMFSKRLLTMGATFTPAFRIANMIRDTVHSFVVSKSFMPFVDTARGFVKVWKESPEFVALMASGGGFGQGWVESGDPKAMAREISKIIKRETTAKGTLIDTPRKALDLWQKIGMASEMAARVQLYSNLRGKGVSHMEAAFEARDLLDFFKSGAGNSVRVLMAVSPFLNARVQGLDRLYRGAKQDKAAFMTKGAMVAAASIMLWLLFKDDDRYKDLEDWEKWQYHHFWIGDMHYRIPKAFETGALFSTLFESLGNVMAGNEEWDFFGRFLTHTLRETFAADIPVFFGPTIEAYANKSAFTGRPIESMAQQRMRPGERANPWTPELLKDLGKITNISPVKAEHIIQGHTAAFGAIFLTIADAAYRMITDAPTRPAKRLQDIPGIGRFVRDDDSRTKYATRYYEFAREVNELAAAVNNYKNLGEPEMAKKILSENIDTLRHRKLVNRVQGRLSLLRKREKYIWNRRDMTPEQKREELKKLADRKNELVRRAYEAVNQ